jgi:hypothetical protein
MTARTIEVDGRCYELSDEPQRCCRVAGGLQPCDRPATHTGLWDGMRPVYFCAACARHVAPRYVRMTLVDGIYDTASPRRVR